MPTPVTINWTRILTLLIELIKLLAPLFSDAQGRRRVERARVAMLKIGGANQSEELRRIFCAIVHPSLTHETDTALKNLNQVMPAALNWDLVIEAFCAFLKWLLDLFDPDGNHNPDPPSDDLVKYTVVTARGTVTRTQLNTHAKQLATLLNEVSQTPPNAVDDSTLKLREQTRELLTDALANDAEEWHDFSAAMDAALDRLADKGFLNNSDQYRRAFADIAQGLNEA